MILDEVFTGGDDSGVPVELLPLEIIITEEELLGTGLPILESIWMPSNLKGIVYRIDPARPEMKQLRHVHLAPENKKTATSTQTACKSPDGSWNL